MKKIIGIALVVSALFTLNVYANQLQSESSPETGSSIEQQVVGVGIVLEKIDSTFLIRDVVNGGPAYRDGRIQQGDLVVAVNQTLLPGDGYVPTAKMTLADVVSVIRGISGTHVGLMIERDDQTLEFILKREKIEF